MLTVQVWPFTMVFFLSLRGVQFFESYFVRLPGPGYGACKSLMLNSLKINQYPASAGCE